MNFLCDKFFDLKEGMPIRRLPILGAWKNSASVICARINGYAKSLKLRIAPPNSDSYRYGVNGVYHPVLNLWYFYAKPSLFKEIGEGEYKFVAVDERENAHVIGEGCIRIDGSRLKDANETPSEDGGDVDDGKGCFLKFDDDMWRSVTVETDESGDLSFVIGEEYNSDFFDIPPRDSYAFNKSTGYYHRLRGLIDESGEPAIEVEDYNTSSDMSTFVKDESTGFFYKIEADVDSVGELALEIGEKR